MNVSSFLKSKSFKYGSIATALTAVFIALIIILNVIFSAVANKLSWFTDLTENELYTLSDEAKTILSGIDNEINIYFASMPDALSSNAAMYYIYQTAKQMSEEYSNIKIECHDVLRENVFFEKYKLVTSSVITATSIIIESNDKYLLYDANNFFIFDEDGVTVWAYNGEYRFLSGILQITATETPVAYFTIGHGEDIAAASALISLFKDSGYDTKSIDLTKEDISDDARFVIIYNPLYDFIGIEAESETSNEIKKVDKFLDAIHHGCLMTFIDSSAVSNLTNLNELLEEWGIEYSSNSIVRDYANSLSVDGKTISLKYNDDKEDYASGMFSEILDMSTLPKSVIKNATPVNILWDKGGDLFGTKHVAKLLYSNSSAEVLKDDLVVSSGETCVMGVSVESRVYDNDWYYSYVLATSPSFVNNNYLITNTYANKDVLNAAMDIMGKEKLLANIEFKVFEDNDLDITTAESNKWTVALTLILPVVVSGLGLVIWIRRKHS